VLPVGAIRYADSMIEEDLEHLRQVLAHAVEASGLLRRDIERALRVRNGSLRQLLDGSLDVQVEHLTAFARLLQFPAGDLLALGCPATRAAATRRLADWLERAPQIVAPPPPSPDELVAMVRSALREELAARRNR
jgi:hypothetical protein